jgi:glycosyltransferase involved in cell wall biosynthesis
MERAMTYHQVLAAAGLGGANRVALQLAARRDGEASRVWVPGPGAARDEAVRLGVAVAAYDGPDAFGRNVLRSAWANAGLGLRLRRGGPGLVHVHGTLCFGTLRAGLWLSGLRQVVHAHLEQDEASLRWALRRPPDLIITCARFLAEQVRRALPEGVRDRQWVEAVPNAVDVERFRPGDRRAAKAKVGAPADRPLLLMLANLAPHKGQETAVRAVAALKARGRDVVCWLAGVEREEGGFTGRLRAMIEEEGVADRVTLLGFRDDAPDLLRAAEFFLLPSTCEGLPLTVLEAQATGVPVLAAPTAGVPEVVRDGATGFLLPAGDPAAYAACVERLLDEPGLARDVTARALEQVTRDCNWDAYFARVRGLYREVLGRGGRSLGWESRL